MAHSQPVHTHQMLGCLHKLYSSLQALHTFSLSLITLVHRCSAKRRFSYGHLGFMGGIVVAYLFYYSCYSSAERPSKAIHELSFQQALIIGNEFYKAKRCIPRFYADSKSSQRFHNCGSIFPRSLPLVICRMFMCTPNVLRCTDHVSVLHSQKCHAHSIDKQ